MPRVPKTIAKELIQFVKKVEVRANFWDPIGKSAYEFGRQMSSSKLAKSNTAYECNMIVLPNDSTAAPSVTAEFLDGSKWQVDTGDYTCNDLRSLFYEHAEKVRILDGYEIGGLLNL